MTTRMIDTLTIAPESRVPAWESHLRAELFSAKCIPLDGATFWGVQTNDDLGRIGVTSVRVSSHVLEHDPGDVGSEGDVLVSFLVEGEAVIGQAGQWLHMSPGDVVLCPSGIAFTYVSTQPIHALVLRIPQALFRLVHDEPLDHPMSIRRQGGARRFDQHALVEDLARWLSSGPRDGAAQMQGRVIGIIEALLRSGRRGGGMRAHYLAARAVIVEQLHDPRLTPERVARILNLSARQLHRIFAHQGTSMMTEVTECRLQHALMILQDPTFDDLPIAEVGYRCGFSGPAVFSRLFRRRFGHAPQSARRDRVGQGAELGEGAGAGPGTGKPLA